jgi:glycerol-3-phosphate acyltransferase PlsX
VVHAELKKQGGDSLLGRSLRVVHAPEVAQMDDKPAAVVRRRDTSMRVAYELCRSGDAQAVVSAGNSGAYMGVALVVFGRIKGVLRPAIGTVIPTHAGRPVLLLDAGANTAVAPEYLVQWAFMGDAYARALFKRERPSIGVLSNGEEDTKGTDLTRAANDALRRLGGNELNYQGYCEGRDIMSSQRDVVVTDGFTGNVVLKTLEGVGQAVKEGLTARFSRSLISKLQYLMVANVFTEMKHLLDYRMTGGAPLLGVNGVAIVAHGKSDAMALGHALRVARLHVTEKLNDALTASVERHAALFPDAKERARDFGAAPRMGPVEGPPAGAPGRA